MNQAAISRKYPQVKVETGAQSTYPIYDNDNNKLKEWRIAEIQIESKDFKAASQLLVNYNKTFRLNRLILGI
jgi:predicted secreted protein